ncbi:hypothetical protein L1049_017356 [Liquidambar formosana]|uniref:F-box domain-containing protein n=1 Tax=Liquidambar formosana TaxID=63359 RepID=A0AAP0S8A0_LIQFO
MADDHETYDCRTKTIRKWPDWSHLPSDLLESILKRLSYANVIRFTAVCSSWRSVVRAYISSNSSYPRFLQAPWLMFPPEKESKDGDTRLFNLEEKRPPYAVKDGMLKKELSESRCLGSSHGWLVLLDQTECLYLLNPFSRTRIQLPDLPNFHSIAKAVLSSDPGDSNDCTVLVMYAKRSNLAFCKVGDGGWTNLDGKHESYSDILFFNDHLYALPGKSSVEVWDLYALPDKSSVEVWDFREPFPTRRHINLSYPEKTMEELRQLSPSDIHCRRLCLVEWSGHILLVARFLGYLSNDDREMNIKPRTMLFELYKLDFNEEKWIEVDSLGDGCLFLGENHSLSLSAQDVRDCKENSIYFINFQVKKHYTYGRLALDVFNLEDQSFKSIYRCNFWRNKPVTDPAVWIVPNPW